MGYKLKTHRGAAKRFKLTATGKVKRDKANGSHLLTHKSASRMRRLTTACDCSSAETRMIKKLCPYK
jgi:large subunit ribosomal protein L35